MSKLLTDRQCQQILENRFQTKEINLIDFELKPISENLEGYMGEHYNLTLTYKQNGETQKEILFMKRKPAMEAHAKMSDDMRVYEKEILFYDVFLRKFEAKGYDTSFAPKSYFCIPDEAVIMDNLISKGYQILERCQMFDMKKIKYFLKTLALYHGAAFAYEKAKSAELGKNYKLTDDHKDILREDLFCQYLTQNPTSMKWLDGCTKTISSIIKILPKDEQYKNEFLYLYLNYPLGKIFADEAKFAKTLGHGDLWSNNVMFKFDGNIPTECCLVDFQLVRYFYPAFDVLLSVYGNTDAEFCKKHSQEIFEYYYDTLASIVENYGYDINEFMTRDEFYKSLQLVKPECLFQVAITDTFVYTPKEELSNAVQSDENSLETLMFNNSDSSVKLFKENESFRNRITNILYDLYDALLVVKKDNIC